MRLIITIKQIIQLNNPIINEMNLPDLTFQKDTKGCP
jgi:hypothetical protein